MKFDRGEVVQHKVMGGKGVVLDEITEGEKILIQVRMQNGNIEKFYAEELESEAVIRSRVQVETDKINRMNAENAKKIDPYH